MNSVLGSRPVGGSRWSLTSRLTVVLVTVVALAAAGISVLTQAVIRSYLVARTDEQAVAAAGPAVVALTTGGPGSRETPLGELRPQRRPRPRQALPGVPEGSVAALYASDGSFLRATSLSLDSSAGRSASADPLELDRSLVENPPLAADEKVVDASMEGRPYRAFVAEAFTSGEVLVVGIPMAPVEDTISRLRWTLFGVSSLAALAAALVGMLLTRSQLTPLRTMAATADRVTAGDLDQRVGHEGPTEVARLGGSFDAMLDRLQGEIHERRRSEERIRQFAADASHELRTPITSIRGWAEMFRRGADKRPEDLRNAMRHIEDEATRMSGLVEQLLALARAEGGAPRPSEPVDLVGLVSAAAASAGVRSADHPVGVDIRHAGRVMGDPAALRRVVDNLLSNATVHTPPGTRVTLTLDAEPPTPEAPKGRVVIAVGDDGPGMPPELVARAFDRFSRGDVARRRSGAETSTGLGLAISEAVVRAHGGTVELASAQGRGTVVIVRLPAADSAGPGAQTPGSG